MNKPDGGPAFPVADIYHPDGQIEYGPSGMSLRDYFAAKALQGLLSRADLGSWEVGYLAASAYEIADAMLRAREADHD